MQHWALASLLANHLGSSYSVHGIKTYVHDTKRVFFSAMSQALKKAPRP